MWKKLRFYYWLVKGFLQKHKWVIVPAALIGGLTVLQLPLILRYAPQPKETHYVGRVGQFTLANLPRDIQTKVSSGLTTIDEQGRPQPSLAKDWRVLDEGKTYLFTLRDNVYWQDGSSVLASDVNYTINQVEHEIIDDKTVAFRLQEPYAAFPQILSQPLFKREQTKYLQVVEQTQIIGTGEYRLKKLKFNGPSLDSLTMESDTKKIIYRFYPTEQAAILAFKLAEIDRIEDLSSPGELAEWSSVTIENSIDYQQYAAIFFKLKTEEAYFADKKIRQALAYAIPKSQDPSLRAISPISPKSWAYNPNVKPYDYSLESAKELLQGLKTDFTIELTTTPNFSNLAEEIKTSWQQLGFEVQVKVVNFPDTSNYQVLLIGQRVPYDPDQYLLWHETQETNITDYGSAKVDKLLEDGRKEIDEDLRQPIYFDFQRFLVEDTPAVFLHFLQSYAISRS